MQGSHDATAVVKERNRKKDTKLNQLASADQVEKVIAEHAEAAQRLRTLLDEKKRSIAERLAAKRLELRESRVNDDTEESGTTESQDDGLDKLADLQRRIDVRIVLRKVACIYISYFCLLNNK